MNTPWEIWESRQQQTNCRSAGQTDPPGFAGVLARRARPTRKSQLSDLSLAKACETSCFELHCSEYTAAIDRLQ